MKTHGPTRDAHGIAAIAHDEGDRHGRSAAARGRRASIDFGAGEPDFPTPPSDQGGGARRRSTRTSPSTRRSAGIAELKRAICERYRLDYGVEYQESEVIVTRRRQAGALQHGAGAVRPRRRGHHARAVLADAHRAGQAGRRDAGARADARRRTASRSRAAPDPGRGHAAARAASSSTRRAIRPAR